MFSHFERAGRNDGDNIVTALTIITKQKGKAIMAGLSLAQIAHLTQELIEHLTLSMNLVMRNKLELERMQQIMKTLCTVQKELERELGDERK